MLPEPPTIGLIGVGNLGTALSRGLLGGDPTLRLLVFDPDDARVDALLAAESRPTPMASAAELAGAADVVMVVVKPQDMDVTLDSFAAALRPDQHVVSTAAGVTLDRLRLQLETPCCLFRIMPNLAVAYGEGVVALAAEDGTSAAHIAAMERLFQGLGMVRSTPEWYFDAVTALTGSGPGFLALVLEGMEDGGVAAGLPRDLARAFVGQMALGSGHLLREERISPASLKDRVSSPAGTTMAGLAVLEEHGVRGAFLRAVQAAAERGRQL